MARIMEKKQSELQAKLDKMMDKDVPPPPRMCLEAGSPESRRSVLIKEVKCAARECASRYHKRIGQN